MLEIFAYSVLLGLASGTFSTALILILMDDRREIDSVRLVGFVLCVFLATSFLSLCFQWSNETNQARSDMLWRRDHSGRCVDEPHEEGETPRR